MEILETTYIWIHTENENETQDICEYLIKGKNITIEKNWLKDEQYLIKTNNLSFNRADFQRWRSIKYSEEEKGTYESRW